MELFLPISISALFLILIINYILRKFHLPVLLGYIATGLIIRQIFHLGEENSKYLLHIAETGIVLLMFNIGLEFSIQHLKKLKKEVFILGPLQLLITTLLFFLLIFSFLSLSITATIVISLTLSLSSTAIALKILNESKDINLTYGKTSFGILIFQDIAVVPVILLTEILSSENNNSALLIGKILIGGFGLWFLIWLIDKYLLNPFLDILADQNSSEIFMIAVLFIVSAFSYIAHLAGFSYTLGAFIGGLVIAESKYKFQVEARLEPFKDIMLGMFFFSVGVQIDLQVFYTHIITIIIFLLIILSVKTFVLFSVSRIFLKTKNAFKTAVTLSQVGEFSFVLFELASNKQLIENELSQILIMATVLSMIITPFTIRHVRKICDVVFHEDSEQIHNNILENHVVVVGYGWLGENVAKELIEKNIDYIIVESRKKVANIARLNHHHMIQGDVSMQPILKNAHIEKSSSIILAIDNEEKIRNTVQSILDYHPSAHIIVCLSSIEHQERIYDLPIASIVPRYKNLATELVNKVQP